MGEPERQHYTTSSAPGLSRNVTAASNGSVCHFKSGADGAELVNLTKPDTPIVIQAEFHSAVALSLF